MAKDNKKNITTKRQAGVSLIITLFVMIIILSVVLSVSTLLYSEIKVLRNVGNSVVGLYAADSGIEKVLYYDRQFQPNNGQTCSDDSNCASFDPYISCSKGLCVMPVSRGLCSMFESAFASASNNSCSGSGGDSSALCNSTSVVAPLESPDGCKPDVCNNCTVSFGTALDSVSGINYSTTARVYPDISYNNFEIDSKGTFGGFGGFGGASRQVQILIKTLPTGISGCNPEWQTGTWSACVAGQQTRTVTDANNCETTVDKPAETQSCCAASCLADAGDSYTIGCDGTTTTKCDTGEACQLLYSFGQTVAVIGSQCLVTGVLPSCAADCLTQSGDSYTIGCDGTMTTKCDTGLTCSKIYNFTGDLIGSQCLTPHI